MKKDVIVSNWREVLRHWSLWLAGVGTSLVSWIILAPESVIAAWAMLPDDMKATLPPTAVQVLAIALLVLGIIAKFINQRGLRGP